MLRGLVNDLTRNGGGSVIIQSLFELDPYGIWNSLTEDEKVLIKREPFAAYQIYLNPLLARSYTP